ncbi:MAG: ROK family transcriptional regulator [Lachnospiraceae bacterium]|nr:ROK family transcriptional regulator [Lachnospiraceae bacterium]
MADSRYSGLNMTGIKTANRAMLLKYIFEHGGASRKTLADTLGLTPAAITQITRQMTEAEILIESGSKEPLEKRAGRHQVQLVLNPEYGDVLCVNIGVDVTVLSVCNIWGELRGTVTFETASDDSPRDFLAFLIREGQKLLKEEQRNALRAVSIGIVGEVDRTRGISRRAYGIWEEEVDLSGPFREAFGVPVLVENNVRSFAMAELLFDDCRTFDSLLIVKWGPGVGSTIILKKEIYEGGLSAAGEIGHMIVEPNGRKCSCGRRGCLETIVGAAALKEHGADAEAVNGRQAGPHIPGAAAANPTDERRGAAYLDYAFDTLARALVNEMTILDPDHVILYGDFFRNKKMREEVLSHLASYDKSYISRIAYTGLSGREAYIGQAAEAASAFIRGDSGL